MPVASCDIMLVIVGRAAAPITESQTLFQQARALKCGDGVKRGLAEAARL